MEAIVQNVDPRRTQACRPIPVLAKSICRAFLAAAFLTSRSASAETVELFPVADTTLIEAAPTNNLGGQLFLNAGATGPNSGMTRNRALVQFDPGAVIPAGSLVLAAQVTLEVVGEPGDSATPSTFTLHRVLRTWGEGDKTSVASPGLGAPASEGEATWFHRLAWTGEDWGQPGGQADLDFAGFPSASQFVYGIEDSPYDFLSTTALVADVQSWLDEPASNQGWMLMSAAESSFKTARRFGSREDPVDPPRLRIDFIRPPTIDRARTDGGRFELEFIAQAGLAYRVEVAADTARPVGWQLLTNVAAPPIDTAVTVTDGLTNSRAFYRLVAESP